MRELSGEVALVTGGNSGIGLARGLAAAGAAVCIWGRDKDKNAAATAALSETGADVHALVCDVSHEDQVLDSFAQTLERFGKVDSCFANAGHGPTQVPFIDVDLDLDRWRHTIAVNLDGAMLTLREAARHMVTRGDGGSLIAVSSTSAIHGAPNNASYAVSKPGLLGLTRSLAVELARHNIRSNALLPGWTDTDMLAWGRANERFTANTIGRTPVRRWADPDEFGAIAVYLARRALAFHTGDEVVVDGGYTRF